MQATDVWLWSSKGKAMQNQPPNPQRYPPNYAPPYSQPAQPTYPAAPQYSQPLPPPYPPYPPYPQQQQDNSTAVVLEAILSLFGFYGIGWMFRGHVGTGIVLLVLGFVWVGVAILITIFTFGFGLLCIGPLHLVFIVLDVLALNNTLRQPWQR